MHVPKTNERDKSKSKACNFMNVGGATSSPSSRSSHDLCVFRGFSCLFIILLLGTGSQEGSIGMAAPHGNQLYTGSEAFILVLEL